MSIPQPGPRSAVLPAVAAASPVSLLGASALAGDVRGSLTVPTDFPSMVAPPADAEQHGLLPRGLRPAAARRQEQRRHLVLRGQPRVAVAGAVPAPPVAEDAGVEDRPGSFAGVTLAHNVRSKADVQALFDAVGRAGARPGKPPQDVFWGGHSSYVADPDGFLWEIAFNPYSWIE